MVRDMIQMNGTDLGMKVNELHQSRLRTKSALFALFGLIADSGPDVNLIPNTGQVIRLLVLSKWLPNFKKTTVYAAFGRCTLMHDRPK